jgi:hypothetical protein
MSLHSSRHSIKLINQSLTWGRPELQPEEYVEYYKELPNGYYSHLEAVLDALEAHLLDAVGWVHELPLELPISLVAQQDIDHDVKEHSYLLLKL